MRKQSEKCEAYTNERTNESKEREKKLSVSCARRTVPEITNWKKSNQIKRMKS